MKKKDFITQYQKKLSHILAGIILCTIWIIMGVTEGGKYINQNYTLSKNLHTKTLQIQNIIKNKQLYTQIEEITLKKIIKNILTNSSISIDDTEVINLLESTVDIENLKKNTVTTVGDYGVLLTTYSFANVPYTIIVEQKKTNSLKKFLQEYLLFLILSFPLYAFFYFVGYIFFGKSFQPLRKNIENIQKFSSDVNHEFKTPLSEIISSLQLAKKTKDTNLIDTAVLSAKKLNNTLDTLGAMTNFIQEDYKRQKINILPLLGEVTKTYDKQIQEKSIDILSNIEKNTWIFGNQEHLEICLSNILSNAIKYSHKNGKIMITGDKKHISITDFGVGISQKNTQKIFHHYFRESYIPDGTGIGLSIVKRLCDINTWKIEVKSQKSKGSSFTIYFF